MPAVLIDEEAGRAAARRLGLLPLGVLGTLVRAKQRGLIDRVDPLVASLVASRRDRFLCFPGVAAGNPSAGW